MIVVATLAVFIGALWSRSKGYIGLNMSRLVWKALVGQEVHREDLDSVDVLLTRSMQDIRTIHQKGKPTYHALVC